MITKTRKVAAFLAVCAGVLIAMNLVAVTPANAQETTTLQLIAIEPQLECRPNQEQTPFFAAPSDCLDLILAVISQVKVEPIPDLAQISLNNYQLRVLDRLLPPYFAELRQVVPNNRDILNKVEDLEKLVKAARIKNSKAYAGHLAKAEETISRQAAPPCLTGDAETCN